VQISIFDLNADLLVVGFGDDGPNVATISNPGGYTNQGALGFWCIGSGAPAAQMSMFARRFSFKMSSAETAYYIYEAKRAAESAAGVSPETAMYVVKHNSPPIKFNDASEQALNDIWSELKPRNLSDAHKAAIAALDPIKFGRRSDSSASSLSR
jgi:20S proteasome alpha/beta subunit